MNPSSQLQVVKFSIWSDNPLKKIDGGSERYPGKKMKIIKFTETSNGGFQGLEGRENGKLMVKVYEVSLTQDK